jgi:hypothetical protein
MAKAKRVHSTPRRTASKIKADSVKNPGQPDLDHAEAFRDLEAPIASLFCMAEIAAEVTNERNTDERIEMTHFAVYRLRDVIRDLRDEYLKGLHTGKALQS